MSRSTGGERGSETSSGRTTGPGRLVRVTEGARAGFVATLTMAAYRLPVSRSLPPTGHFWAEFVAGGEPDDHPLAAITLHLLYGIAGGVVFGILAPVGAHPTRATENSPDTSTAESRETAYREATGLLWGAFYGLALSLFGERGLLEGLLGMRLEADERLVFHASHLVYGLSLGTWFGSRTSDEQ